MGYYCSLDSDFHPSNHFLFLLTCLLSIYPFTLCRFYSPSENMMLSEIVFTHIQDFICTSPSVCLSPYFSISLNFFLISNRISITRERNSEKEGQLCNALPRILLRAGLNGSVAVHLFISG